MFSAEAQKAQEPLKRPVRLADPIDRWQNIVGKTVLGQSENH